jgi:hypothetical protein
LLRWLQAKILLSTASHIARLQANVNIPDLLIDIVVTLFAQVDLNSYPHDLYLPTS